MSVTENSRHLTRALAAMAVALAAAAAAPAAAQQTTIADGAAPAAQPLCPGGAPATADYFTAASTGAGETIRRLRVQVSPPGAYSAIDRVEIKTMAGVTLASATPSSDQFDVTPATPIAVTATETQYRIDVTTKPRASMPTSSAGLSVTARVLDVLVSYRRTVSDTSSAMLALDNTPPADVGWTTMTVTTTPLRISLGFRPPLGDAGFTAPDAGVVVLRRASQPVNDAPGLGASLASIGGVGAAFGQSEVRFSGVAGSATWGFSDTGAAVVAGTSYYYRAFVRDSCGNWSAGEAVGPVYAGVSEEGDPNAFSLKPMVGILNPNPGVVTSPFKVQVRIFSPKNGGTAQPIQLPPTLTLTGPGGGSFNLVQNTAYGNATESGVFEPASAISVVSGDYTLQARAQNTSGFTFSAKIPITVAAGRGDGNLLVRDNSSQLCNDCHALPTHSSESTTNKYGAWYAGCRSCHQPHGTPNASLIATDVIPPQVAGQLPPTRVYFSKRAGFDPSAGATNTATISAASYANGDRTGPCQACHTRTAFYTRAGAQGDGGPGNHYTQNCGDCHKHKNGFGASCTACHGSLTPRTPVTANADSLLNAAPPRDSSGGTATTLLGVGAHEKHVNGNTWRTDPITCDECHTIPNTHNGSVQLPLGGPLTNTSYDWAGGAGPAPTWDRPSARCSNTYCHGNFRGGDNLAQPVWTAAGTVVCGSCHGRGGTDPRPAGGVHAAISTSCTGCHAAGYSMTTVDKSLHLNGVLNASGCDGCHGEPTRTAVAANGLTDDYVRPMPPKDASSNTLTTFRGVGAHQQHVDNLAGLSSLARPITCDNCHPLPLGASGHNNGTVALQPAIGFNGVAVSCANACHGSAARGGLLPTPTWTVVDGTYRACNACHGQPPPVTDGGHPPNAVCANCHAGYTGATVVRDTHVDGTKNVRTATGCARCHGSLQDGVAAGDVNTAPGMPGTFDAHGNASTVTSAKGVGAHRAHLASAMSNAFACTVCHPSPNYADAAHANNAAAVPFPAGLASTQLPGDPTVPAPSYANPSCSSVYCHGQFQGGKGPSAAPVWNAASLTAMNCSSCHNSPPVPAAAAGGVPASYHPNNSACGSCHTGYTASSVASVKATHVDGQIQRVATTGCAQCHGVISDGIAATDVNVAPGVTGAVDSKGNAENLTANAGVGAHKAHLQPRWVNAFACTECHPSYADKVHANGSPAVVFSPTSIATTQISGDTIRPAPAYATNQCSNTLCHGRFTGGTSAAPTWATAGLVGTSMTCTSCHGNPPTTAPGGRAHPNNTNCGSTSCHGTGYSDTNVTGVALGTHINGQVNYAALSCTSCHGSTTLHASVSGADPLQTAAPPLDAEGLTSSASVGAHLAHVNRNTNNTPVRCDQCHRNQIPASPLHANGATIIDATTFGTTATNAGAVTPTYAGGACASTYCHGNFEGGRNASPLWTGTAIDCTSCHLLPPVPAAAAGGVPVSYHPNNTNCNACHTGYSRTGATTGTTVASTHVNRTIERIATTGCAQCHGVIADGAGNTAPSAAPGYVGGSTGIDSKGNSAVTAVGVGAHDAHVRPAGSLNATAPLACTNCHPNRATGDVTHANATVEVGWSALVSSTGIPVAPTAFDATWEGGAKTCSNYCHSNAQPLGGTRTAGTTPSWTTAGNLSCTSCHQFAADDTRSAASTNLSHGHFRHLATVAAGGYYYNCSVCHSGVATGQSDNPAGGVITGPANHVSGVHTLSFDAARNPGTPSYNQGPAFTCSNLYCHSNGTVSPPGTPPANVTARWDGTRGCTMCHGMTAADPIVVGSTGGSQKGGSATHLAHVANATVLGTNYRCSDCHLSTVAAGTDATMIGTTVHVNGAKTVSIANRGSFPSTDTTGTCSATYCHSSGQATPAYVSISWASAAIGCNGCHGTGNSAGAPAYASGGAGTATANSHLKHTANGTDATSCDDCHAQTVTAAGGIVAASAVHTNGQREIAIASSWDANGAATNYVPATKSCGNLTCHGSGSPQWGGPSLSCSNCHLAASDVPSYAYGDGTVSSINNAEWAAVGHGNGAATFNEFGAATDRCVYCHDGNVTHATSANPFRLRGAADVNGITGAYNALSAKNGNEVCLNCHDNSNTVAYGVDPDGAASPQPRACQGGGADPCDTRVDAWHSGGDHVALQDGGKRCWDCHDPHGDLTNIKMIASRPTSDSTDDYGFAGTRVAIDVVFTGTATVANYVNTTSRNGVCQACHTTTAYWRSGSEPTWHHASIRCVECHDHRQGTPAVQTDAFAGAGDCTQCHNQAKTMAAGGTRANVVGEFGLTWSHKRSGGRTVTKEDCVVCHMEGTPATGLPSSPNHSDGSIHLRDPDTGGNIKQVQFNGALAGASAGSYGAVTGDPDMAFTTFRRNLGQTLESDPDAARVQAIMVNQCLKCHDGNGALAFDPGNALSVMAVGGRNKSKPFGTTIGYSAVAAADGGTSLVPTGVGTTANGIAGGVINVAASFAATNSSYHPVLGRNNNAYANGTRMVSPYNVAVAGKNASTTGGSASTNVYGYLLSCWDCHAPNGSTNATRLSRTVTAHGGATTLRARATITGTPSSTNQVALCMQCHAGYQTATSSHGTGSALSATTNGTMTAYLNYGCTACHSSGYSTSVIRPIRAEDAHGFNALRTGTNTGRWNGAIANAAGTTTCYTGSATVGSATTACTTAQVDRKPYAFIRNNSGGSVSIRSHYPARIGTGTTSIWYKQTSAATSANGAGCDMGSAGSGICTRNSGYVTPMGTY